MLDNISIAIILLVNELAARYEIKPYEFVASLETNEAGLTALAFETVPANEASMSKYYNMLSSIGLDEGNTDLIGDDQQIYTLLLGALNRAPRAHGRQAR